jgi:hypothetical protein
MPRVGFEPTIPALERVKAVHALDRAATVIGGGIRIGRGNRSTRRKSAPMPLCPSQIIPHNLTWDRTRAAAVGSRRLTA